MFSGIRDWHGIYMLLTGKVVICIISKGFGGRVNKSTVLNMFGKYIR